MIQIILIFILIFILYKIFNYLKIRYSYYKDNQPELTLEEQKEIDDKMDDMSLRIGILAMFILIALSNNF